MEQHYPSGFWFRVQCCGWPLWELSYGYRPGVRAASHYGFQTKAEAIEAAADVMRSRLTEEE